MRGGVFVLHEQYTGFRQKYIINLFFSSKKVGDSIYYIK